MKRTILALCATFSGLLGLLLVPTLLYNLAALFKIQDGADGPMWETTLVVLACLGLVSGAIFLSYSLFRLVASTPNSNPR